MSASVTPIRETVLSIGKVESQPYPQTAVRNSWVQDSLDTSGISTQLPLQKQEPATPSTIHSNEHSKISTLLDLVSCLQSTKKESPSFLPLQKLALSAVRVFEKDPRSDRAYELSLLVKSQDPILIRAVLMALTNTIKDKTLLDPELLQALSHALSYAESSSLKKDDLLQILQFLEEMNAISSSTSQLSQVQALASTLDSMASLNVKGISKENTSKKLDAFLEGLSKNSDLQLAAVAKYARQALARIPTDESKFSCYLKKALHVGEGISLLMQAWGEKSITTAIDALKQFRSALKSEISKKEWYETFQLCKILIQSNELSRLSSFLDQNPSLFNQDLVILLIQEIKQREISSQEANQLETKLKALCPNVKLQTSLPIKPKNALISLARTTLSWRIEEFALRRLDLPEEYNLYVPGEGATDPEDSKRFDVADKCTQFCEDTNKKVLLIQGGSGAGKSMFLRLMEVNLWHNHQEKSPIPLYIRLGGIDPFKTTLIEDALDEQGFDEAQIAEIKQTRSLVVLLDGYDEMKEGTLVNLFHNNHLSHWSAKVIMTCRTQHLASVTNYTRLFAPYKDEKIDFSTFEEMHILPFSPSNIKAYLEQYVKQTASSWNAERYLKEIASFRNLSSLIETPFVLNIVARVLPNLVAKRDPTKDLEMTRRALYNAFSEDWIERQRLKLVDASLSIPEDFKEACLEFCETLAAKMYGKGIVEVDYSSSGGLFAEERNSEWDSFFGDDHETSLIRSGCPITKTACGYAFIHKSLLEHYSSQSMSQELALMDIKTSQPTRKKSLKKRKEKPAFKNPLEMKTARDLARLVETTTSTKEKALLIEVAHEMISQFNSVEDASELAELAAIKDTSLTQALLEKIAHPLDRNLLLSPEIFSAISRIVQLSAIENLNPDSLLAILDLMSQKIETLYKIDSNETLYLELKTLAAILDALNDANTLTISAEKIEALYDQLSAIKSSHIQIKALQAYVGQAILRLPSDESKFALLLKKGNLLIEGLSSLTEAVGTYSPLKLVEGLKSFREAFKTKDKKRSWYEEIRVLSLLLKSGHIKEALDYVHTLELKIPKAQLALDLLDRAIRHSSSEETRLLLIKELFTLKERLDPSLQECVSSLLSNYTSFDSPDIKTYLQEMPQGFTDPQLVFYTEKPFSISQDTLFNRARTTLVGRLLELHRATAYDPTLQEEESLNIALQGADDITDEPKDYFDLEQKVREFLEGDKKVLLLLGYSGSGKSFFTKLFISKLAKECQDPDFIPLFISLTGIPTDSKEIIRDALHTQGFTDTQIKELKQTKRFLFVFDGRDEMQEKGTPNLYKQNLLGEWNAQVIFTCRTQYLENKSRYKEWFVPYSHDKSVYESLQEITTIPFSDSQIDGYLTKYITHTGSSWSLDVYRSHISALPGLREMIETPFVLRIMTEVLPDLIEKYRLKNTQEKLSLTRVDLYDAFVRKWGRRQIDKLIRSNKLSPKENVEEDFYQFSTKLAARMHTLQLTEVLYTPPSRFHKEASEWDKFFNNTDGRIIRVRTAAPLLVSQKGKEISYRFIHASLLEFLASRESFATFEVSEDQLLSPLEVSAETTPAKVTGLENSNLNQRFFGRDKGTLNFWVDDVNQKEGFKEKLREIIELSKTNPSLSTASANALSVLVAANYCFSREDLSCIQAQGAILDGGNFYGTNFEGANLQNTSLSGAGLSYASFKNANLKGVTLEEGLTLEGHTANVNNLTFDPSGERIASGSWDNTVRLWETASGVCLRIFEGHTSWVSSVAFDPSGNRLVSGSDDNTVRLWEAASGICLRIFEGHTKEHASLDSSFVPSGILSVAFDPAGKRIASGSGDYTVRLWEATTGICLRVFQGHTNEVSSVAFDPSGKSIASGDGLGEGRFRGDSTVRLWEADTGICLRVFEGHTARIRSLAFNPSGERIASGSEDSTVRLWEATTGICLRVFEGHRDSVNSVAFDPSGKRIASGSTDKTVRLWETDSGQSLKVFEGHGNSVNSVAFDPSGKRIASGSDDNSVRLWQELEKQNRKNTEENRKHTVPVVSVTFDFLGKRIASGSYDNTVRLWEATTGICLKVFRGHPARVYSIAFDPSGERIASGNGDNTVRLWEATTGICLKVFQGHTDLVSSVAFDPSVERIASGSEDNSVRLWEAATGICLKVFRGHTAMIKSVAFDPSGERIASGSRDNTARLWEAATGICLRVFEGHTSPFSYLADSGLSSIAFDPLGERLASGSEDNSVRLWEAATGICLRVFEGHTAGVKSVAFDSSGERIASGSEDNSVRLWEAATGICLRVFEGHTRGILSIAFDPSGERLVSGSRDSAVHIWTIKENGRDIEPKLNFKQTRELNCKDLKLEGCQLSAVTKAIFVQKGAIEEFPKVNNRVSEQKKADTATFDHKEKCCAVM